MENSQRRPIDRLYRGFRLATMLPAGTSLSPFPNLPFQVEDASGLGIVKHASLATRDGKIAWILPDDCLPKQLSAETTLPGDRDESGNPTEVKVHGIDLSDTEVIEGRDQWLTPGLIDCHTHLIYGGNRANEWEARLAGATYADIAKAGGGILASVRSTRAATDEELLASAARRLAPFMREGVTTVEIKSGYGLNLENELKMLRVAQQLGQTLNISVEPTLLAAHAVPEEYRGRTEEYAELICQEIIPAAKGWCTSVDAFCETIAFNWQQTERVLQAALQQNLKIKIHAEQLSDSGSAAAAAKLGALSADHLEYLRDEDCLILARHGTVATLLPGAFYCLRETQLPPIAALRAAGVPLAVASDANPGSSPLGSLLLAANMACNFFV